MHIRNIKKTVYLMNLVKTFNQNIDDFLYGLFIKLTNDDMSSNYL